MENIKQNWKNVQILFRFLVSFSGFVFQENETQNNDPQKTKPSSNTRNLDAGAAKLRPHFIPACYSLQGHKPGTGNAARVLYDRVLFYLRNSFPELWRNASETLPVLIHFAKMLYQWLIQETAFRSRRWKPRAWLHRTELRWIALSSENTCARTSNVLCSLGTVPGARLWDRDLLYYYVCPYQWSRPGDGPTVFVRVPVPAISSLSQVHCTNSCARTSGHIPG